MGAVLSSPVELVRVQRHGSAGFRVGVAEMQGWRSGHEDAHEIRCGDSMGAFWVLDGHGGDSAALAGAPDLGKEFAEAIKRGEFPERDRIEAGFVNVDKNLREQSIDSGSTVTGAFIRKESDGTYTVQLVNCGDSRGIIVRSNIELKESAKEIRLGTPEHLAELAKDPEQVARKNAPEPCQWPLVQESIDHKPDHPTERSRIEAVGGYVSEDEPPRLDGNLAVSRGLGDFEYKGSTVRPPAEQKVSCIPDIYEARGLAPGSVCVLCCDGVYDVMTSHDVAALVHSELAEDPQKDLGEIATRIVRESLEKQSRDNVTAMIVQLGSGGAWVEEAPVDEVKHYEKLIEGNPHKVTDEEVRNKYRAILRRWQFPEEPLVCAVCGKWLQKMAECPCKLKTATYCNKVCQKKGWKTHKKECPLVKTKK